MKKLITKFMDKFVGKIVKNMTVKIAILCLVVNTATFSMSWFGAGLFRKFNSGKWRVKADQLYQAIAADPENSQISETIQELDQQTKEDQKKIVDYLLEKSIEHQWFDKADIFLAHGANSNMQIKYEKGKKVPLLFCAVMFRKRSLIEVLLHMGADSNVIRQLENNEKDKSKNMTAADWAIFRMLTESRKAKKVYRQLAKMHYCHGGREGQASLLTAEEKKEFEQEKEAFDLFKIDKAYLVNLYSPEICQQHSYQELYNGTLGALLPLVLPVAEVAHIAGDYHGPCAIPDFFDAEDWAREGFAVPAAQNGSRSMVQNGARSVKRNGSVAESVLGNVMEEEKSDENGDDAEYYGDGRTGDGGEGKNYGDNGRE